MSGTVFCYVELARALGNDRPFYALEAAGLREGEEPHERIEEMANAYLRAIGRIDPAGPYLLGGWSMGGMVALEMARQLEAQGRPVALLVVLDAHPTPPAASEAEGSQGALLGSFARDLGLSPDELGESVDEFWQLGPEAQLACVLEQARAANLVLPGTDVPGLRRQLRVFTHNLRAMRAYVPRPCRGGITLIEAAVSQGPAARDGCPGWEELAGGGLARCTVPGDHYTMLRRPDVTSLAEALKARLDAVDLVIS